MANSNVAPLKRTANDILYPSLSVTKALDRNHSLASSMLQSIRKKFAEDMKQRRLVVSFQSEEKTEVDEPPMKRRRFQRRNSKTAAMLMASIVAANFEAEVDEEPYNNNAPSEEVWDGNLKVALELVKELEKRREQGLQGQFVAK